MSVQQKYRVYALLAGANFESIVYMIAAWQGSKWLNENFDQGFDWTLVCFLLALLLVARSWYVMFRMLIKQQTTSNQENGESDENDTKGKS